VAEGRGTTLSPAGQIVTFQQANLAAIVHHGLGDRALKDPQDTQQDENHDDDDHSANPDVHLDPPKPRNAISCASSQSGRPRSR
jgi:hypothetical protein